MDEYLIQPFHDFIRLFDELRVPYALIGGLAVSVHGIPRPTHDLDFTISIDRSQLPRLYEESEKLGYSVSDSHASGWVDSVAGMPPVRVRQWIQGKAIDIDIFLSESRFPESLIERRLQLEVDGVAAWVATPEDLILLKLVAARPRDIGDVLDILLAQGQLDDKYLSDWANELGVTERLADVLSQFNDIE